MKKILFIILTILLITACTVSLASCDELDALLGENNPVGDGSEDKENVGDNEGAEGDKDNADKNENGGPAGDEEATQFTEERDALRAHMAEDWSALNKEFNYKMLIASHKADAEHAYSELTGKLNSAKTLSDLNAIRDTFDIWVGKLYNNEVVSTYIKEDYSDSVMLGELLGGEVYRNLAGKTLCIEKTYTGTEEHTITDDFFMIDDCEVMLTEYEVVVGLPVPFEDGALYAPCYVYFNGAPKLDDIGIIRTYEITDDNPLGWESIELYGRSSEDGEGKLIIESQYATVNGKKFVEVIDCIDRLFIVYNGINVYLTPDKDTLTATFERPTDSAMKTLYYENDGNSYVFNVYGEYVVGSENYLTTVDITYADGSSATFTADGFLMPYTHVGVEAGFAFPILGLEELQYDESGALTEIPELIPPENKPQ